MVGSGTRYPVLPASCRYQLPGFSQLINGRHGVFLVNPFDIYVGRAIALYGEYGEHEVQLFSQFVRSGDTVIEVGANIGAQTVPLAKQVGPTGSIYAFEPQPVIFQNLCANISLNSLLNVHTYPLAAGSAAGKAVLPVVDYTKPGNFGGIELVGQGQGSCVSVVRLDDEFDEHAKVRLLKIDVEGWELSVLKGASGLIARNRPLLYLENDRIDNSQLLIEYIKALNYRIWWHVPYLYNAENFFSNSHNEYPDIASINMLAIPVEGCVFNMENAKEVIDSHWHPTQDWNNKS